MNIIHNIITYPGLSRCACYYIGTKAWSAMLTHPQRVGSAFDLVRDALAEFRDECRAVMGERAWTVVSIAYDTIPIAALFAGKSLLSGEPLHNAYLPIATCTSNMNGIIDSRAVGIATIAYLVSLIFSLILGPSSLVFDIVEQAVILALIRVATSTMIRFVVNGTAALVAPPSYNN